MELSLVVAAPDSAAIAAVVPYSAVTCYGPTSTARELLAGASPSKAVRGEEAGSLSLSPVLADAALVSFAKRGDRGPQPHASHAETELRLVAIRGDRLRCWTSKLAAARCLIAESWKSPLIASFIGDGGCGAGLSPSTIAAVLPA
nr:hypothetical protein Itr_chr10CG14870 [Ipomoea trifida]